MSCTKEKYEVEINQDILYNGPYKGPISCEALILS